MLSGIAEAAGASSALVRRGSTIDLQLVIDDKQPEFQNGFRVPDQVMPLEQSIKKMKGSASN